MKEYDYKKEYKKLLDNYNELKSKSNIKSDEKARKFAYKSLVAQKIMINFLTVLLKIF